MTRKIVISARVDDALAAQLDLLAQAFDRSRGWHVARAIERYVTQEGQFLDMIREGEADLDAGRVHTQEEIEAMFDVRHGRRDAA